MVANEYSKHLAHDHIPGATKPPRSTDADSVDVLPPEQPPRVGCTTDGKGDVEIVIHRQRSAHHLDVDVRAASGTAGEGCDDDAPPPPPPPGLDAEERRSAECPCLDTWSYGTEMFSGCVATEDRKQPWCATRECGHCGDDKVSSNCWVTCDDFSSPPPPPSTPAPPPPAPPEVDTTKDVEGGGSAGGAGEGRGKQAPATPAAADAGKAGARSGNYSHAALVPLQRAAWEVEAAEKKLAQQQKAIRTDQRAVKSLEAAADAPAAGFGRMIRSLPLAVAVLAALVTALALTILCMGLRTREQLQERAPR